ncbi:MAG TPA: hypothetical protein VGD43_10575, partial [Micromonospora sp.]
SPPPEPVPPGPPGSGSGQQDATGGPGQAGGASPAGRTATGAEPEELLKKLFDPLLRRLRTELRLDRERYGVPGGWS